MLVQISKGLNAPGVAFPFAGEIHADAALYGADILAASAARVEGKFTLMTSDSVRFAGLIRLSLKAVCGKCLESVDYPVELSFDEVFVRKGSEQDVEEEERFTFTGDTVELDAMTQTYVILSLPLRYICKQGCSRESIEEMNAAAAQAGKDISPFAILLEDKEEV